MRSARPASAGPSASKNHRCFSYVAVAKVEATSTPAVPIRMPRESISSSHSPARSNLPHRAEPEGEVAGDERQEESKADGAELGQDLEVRVMDDVPRENHRRSVADRDRRACSRARLDEVPGADARGRGGRPLRARQPPQILASADVLRRRNRLQQDGTCDDRVIARGSNKKAATETSGQPPRPSPKRRCKHEHDVRTRRRQPATRFGRAPG